MVDLEIPKSEDEKNKAPVAEPSLGSAKFEKDPEYIKIEDQVIEERKKRGESLDPKQSAQEIRFETQRRYLEQLKTGPVDIGKMEKKIEIEEVDKREELEEAKDRLSKIYGSGQEIVGANIPEKFFSTEIAQEQIMPEQIESVDAEKSISQEILKSAQEQAETSEQIQERLKREEDARGRQIENAKKELEGILGAINNAREKKDTITEYSFYKKAEASFEVAEGKSLKEEMLKRADAELAQENLVRMSAEKYREKFTKKAEAIIEQRKRSNILADRFAGLSVEEKARYIGKNGRIDSNIFSVEVDAKIDRKIDELKKKGISLSKNVFYAMMEKGLKPEDIKVSGFWKKKIEMPRTPMFKGEKSETYKLSKDNFSEMANMLESKFSQSIKNQAGAMIEWEVRKGQQAWKAKKQKCMRDIIKDKVELYKKQHEEATQQQEAEQQRKIQEEEAKEKAVKIKRKKKKKLQLKKKAIVKKPLKKKNIK